jgi:hypothetical protein
MKRDDSAAWYERASELQQQHTDRSLAGEGDVRLALCELWDLAVSAPNEIATAYRELTSKALVSQESICADALDGGELSWEVGGNAKDIALSLGGQMWALDTELISARSYQSLPSINACLCAPANMYVIPRLAQKSKSRRPGPGSGFGKRGVPNHRILPSVVGEGMQVKLLSDPTLALSVGKGDIQALGAALFPKMLSGFADTESGAVASDAEFPDEERCLLEQLDGAFQQPLVAAAWPELSMPPGRLKVIATGMKTRGAKAKLMAGPVLTCAGSWHERRNGEIYNIMHVLNRNGESRFQFDKITTFVGGGVREGNSRGKVIPVLAMPDALVSFAICSDFCDLEIAPHYLELDIDLLIVPSLSHPPAFVGHQANAAKLASTFGTTVFVVQQNEKVKGDEGEKGDPNVPPVGWVLPTVDELGAAAENRPWSLRNVCLRKN